MASRVGDSASQVASRVGDSASDVASRVGDSATEVASRAKDYAGDTADAVRRTGRRAQNQFQRMLQQNPLLVGAGALAIGAAVGLAVPETDRENEWMADARDTVLNKAQDAARTVVQDAVGGAVSSATSAITGNQQ
jgi:ElaB/YqjD/DUF883 family membrane-anchored ribosome-binding protein